MVPNASFFVVRIDKAAQTDKRTKATTVRAAYLGIAHEARYQPKEVTGMMIHSVEKYSPADMALFSPCDIITAFNGKPVRNEGDYLDLLAECEPNQTVTINYISKYLQGGISAASTRHVVLGEKLYPLHISKVNPLAYNLQYGTITAIGSEAHRSFPESNIGDVLFFKHNVEGQPRETGDKGFKDYHHIGTLDNGDELRLAHVDYEVFGILHEGTIIPYKEWVFCKADAKKSELQFKNGVYVFDQWVLTMEDRLRQLEVLKAHKEQAETSTVLSQPTTEANYRNKEALFQKIAAYNKERAAITREMNRKKLIETTALFFNAATADILGSAILPGERLIADQATLYPLEVEGHRFLLAKTIAIEGVVRDFQISTMDTTNTTLRKRPEPKPKCVLIVPDETKNKTEAGVLIPDTAIQRPNKGTVYSINEKTESWLAVGDYVQFSEMSGQKIIVPGEEEGKEMVVLIMHSDEVLTIL